MFKTKKAKGAPKEPSKRHFPALCCGGHPRATGRRRVLHAPLWGRNRRPGSQATQRARCRRSAGPLSAHKGECVRATRRTTRRTTEERKKAYKQTQRNQTHGTRNNKKRTKKEQEKSKKRARKRQEMDAASRATARENLLDAEAVVHVGGRLQQQLGNGLAAVRQQVVAERVAVLVLGLRAERRPPRHCRRRHSAVGRWVLRPPPVSSSLSSLGSSPQRLKTRFSFPLREMRDRMAGRTDLEPRLFSFLFFLLFLFCSCSSCLLFVASGSNRYF